MNSSNYSVQTCEFINFIYQFAFLHTHKSIFINLVSIIEVTSILNFLHP